MSYVQHPPSAMTSDTSTIDGNTYRATASSAWTQYGGYSYRAFDYIISKVLQDGGTALGWSSTGQYNGTTGAHSASTTLGGVKGEWLKIQLPSEIVLKRYVIYPRQTSVTIRSPRKFTILGSTDNTNWDTLDSQSSLSWSASENTQGEKIFNINNNTAYSYYAIVCEEAGNVDGTGGTKNSIQILEWQLFSASADTPDITFSNDNLFGSSNELDFSSKSSFGIEFSEASQPKNRGIQSMNIGATRASGTGNVTIQFREQNEIVSRSSDTGNSYVNFVGLGLEITADLSEFTDNQLSLTITQDSNLLNTVGVSNPSLLKFYHQTNGNWEPAASTTVDTENNTLTGVFTSLSPVEIGAEFKRGNFEVRTSTPMIVRGSGSITVKDTT